MNAAAALMHRMDKRTFVVPPLLRTKTKLSLLDWVFGVWLYLTVQVIAFVVFMGSIFACAYGGGAGIAAGVVGICSSLFAFSWAAVGWEADRFDYSKRRWNVLLNRNRLLAPHASKRKERVWELRRAYKQYSVWPTFEDDDVVLKLASHEYRRRPLGLGGVWCYAMPIELSYSERDDFWGGGYRSAVKKISDPKPEALAEAIEKAEEYAEALEHNSYAAAKKRFEAERIALELRRPPWQRKLDG